MFPQIRVATVDCPNRMKAASATAKALEDLGRLQRTLDFSDGVTFDACVEEASGRFYSLFRDRVLQLTHNFPEVCAPVRASVYVCVCLCVCVRMRDAPFCECMLVLLLVLLSLVVVAVAAEVMFSSIFRDWVLQPIHNFPEVCACLCVCVLCGASFV